METVIHINGKFLAQCTRSEMERAVDVLYREMGEIDRSHKLNVDITVLKLELGRARRVIEELEKQLAAKGK